MNLCSFASGSSGNCTFVGTDEVSVLIDAGISTKRVIEALRKIDRKPEELDAILITHEHADHIQGLRVLTRKFELPIYCTQGTMEKLLTGSRIDHAFASLFHPIRSDQVFSIGDLEVLPFHVSHDAADPVAYRLSGGGKSVAVTTDLGYYDDDTIAHLRNLNAVLLESNHDINMLQVGSYPYYLKQRILGLKGHLSNDSAGRLLGEILNDNMQAVLLGHMSRENNYEALALETVLAEITAGENPYRGTDFPIEAARREEMSRMITV